MTALLPQLEDELLLAHDRVTSAHVELDASADVGRRGHRRATTPAAVLALALAASSALAGGAYAARGLWQPILGTPDIGHATPTADQPPASQMSVLGVLRRDQSPTDRDATVRKALEAAGRDIGQIRTNAVRKLGTLPDGRVAVLIPAHVPSGFDSTIPDARATPDQLLLALYDPVTGDNSGFLVSDALGLRGGDLMLQVAPRLSGAQRNRSRAFIADEIAAGRLQRTAGPPGYSVMSVRQGDRYRTAVGLRDGTAARYIGLVPDGVASVRVDGRSPVPVHGNFFVATTSVGDPQRVQWLDRHGDPVAFANPVGTHRS